MDFQVGDVVRTKKNHPCGGSEWEVLRVGADFRIRCTTCGRMVMVPRTKFEKSVKANLSAQGREAGPPPSDGPGQNSENRLAN